MIAVLAVFVNHAMRVANADLHAVYVIFVLVQATVIVVLVIVIWIFVNVIVMVVLVREMRAVQAAIAMEVFVKLA
jgi:hypothetical protein